MDSASLLYQWMLHFVNHAKPTPEHPVALLLDDHYSHTVDLDTIEIGRKHVDLIVRLPSHSTEKF
jgi:hypothetical protein